MSSVGTVAGELIDSAVCGTASKLTRRYHLSCRHNPPHPGEFLKSDVLPELGISVTAAAEPLGMSRGLNGRAAISADLALRLADWLPPSAESWLRAQAAHDPWEASRKRRPKIKRSAPEQAAA